MKKIKDDRGLTQVLEKLFSLKVSLFGIKKFKVKK